MERQDLISWLKKKEIFSLVAKDYIFFKKVISRSLKARIGEEILIIGDVGFFNHRLSPILSACYYFAAKELRFKTKMVLQTPKNIGDAADKKVIKALRKQRGNSLVILNVSNKVGRLSGLTTSFRKYMKEKGNRFISIGGLGSIDNSYLPFIINSINLDYYVLEKKGEKLKRILDRAKEIKVRTRAGTNLWLDVKGRKAISNDGAYYLPGRGGNLPCGEVYVPPDSTNAEGTVVIDGSVRHERGTELIKNPVTLEIKKGDVVSIKGGTEANLLRYTLEKAYKRANVKKNVRKLGEFGIGINPKTSIIGHTLIDEKTLGTCHVAIGSNSWFGGDIRTVVHLDQVIREPTIFVDKRKIMHRGRLLV